MNRFVICIVFSICGCSIAQNGAIIQAYDALNKKDCETVYKELSNAESYSETTNTLQSEISFIRATCLELEKKYDEALNVYSYIVEQFPNTEYAKRAQARIERPVSFSSLIILHRVAPQYPEDVATKCIEGKVDLAFTVQKDGTVSNVLIKKAEPNTLFNRVSIEAIKQWRFKPKFIDNQLVEQIAQQQFIFNKPASCSTQPPAMQLNKDKTALFVNPDNNINRPSTIDLLLVKGYGFLIEKNPKRAEYFFDKAMGQCKDQYYSKGKRIFAARTQAEALYYLSFYGLTGLAGEKEVIVIKPSCAEALFDKGYTRLELGQIDSAINYLKKAITMSPVNSKFLSELGHSYQLKKDWKSAFDIFTKSEKYARRYSPSTLKQQELLRAKRGIGYGLIEMGALKKAQIKYKECLEIDSNDKKSLIELRYINGLLKQQSTI